MILSPWGLIKACAEGHDIYEKGGNPRAIGLVVGKMLFKRKKKIQDKILHSQ